MSKVFDLLWHDGEDLTGSTYLEQPCDRLQAAGHACQLAGLATPHSPLWHPSSGLAQSRRPEDHSVDDGRERTGERPADGTGHAGSRR
jgi:hypothetical protein